MERIDPERILEQHIKNNPENSEKMHRHLNEDNLTFYDENFDLKEAERNIPEIMGSVTEDKEEIKSKQYQQIRNRRAEIEHKFLQLVNNIKAEDAEIKRLKELMKLSEKSKVESEHDTNYFLSQMTEFEKSIERLNEKIENKEINRVDMLRELGVIMETRRVIGGILRPEIKDGENLNRHEMN